MPILLCAAEEVLVRALAAVVEGLGVPRAALEVERVEVGLGGQLDLAVDLESLRLGLTSELVRVEDRSAQGVADDLDLEGESFVDVAEAVEALVRGVLRDLELDGVARADRRLRLPPVLAVLELRLVPIYIRSARRRKESANSPRS